MFINNTTSGKRFQVDITDTDTVRGLKAQITDELGVPAKYQHISFNGMNLRDDTATLSKYQMGPSSEVSRQIYKIKGWY